MNPLRIQEMRDSIAAQTNPFAVLDFVWLEINALDGEMFGAIDQMARERMKGYKAAISQSLEMIEQMGGQDPLARKPVFPYACIRERRDDEFRKVKLLADRILDTPGQDPDDDLSSLSRQFLRLLERLKESIRVRSDLVHVIVGILRAIDEQDGETQLNELQRAADMIGYSKPE